MHEAANVSKDEDKLVSHVAKLYLLGLRPELGVLAERLVEACIRLLLERGVAGATDGKPRGVVVVFGRSVNGIKDFQRLSRPFLILRERCGGARSFRRRA